MKSYREKRVPVYALAISFVAISSFLFSIILSKTYASSSSSVVDEITIDIPASCSLTNTVGSAHTATIETGVYQENIGETTFKVFCNDSEGFAVYAVGFTNDEFGNNTLKPAVVDNNNAVVTGTATSGNTSNWAMKLSAVSGTYAPTIHSTEENSNTYSFTSYHTIPSEYTKVASYSSNTDVTTGSSFKSTYAAFISQTQLADSYTGKVKYTVVHPSSELAPIENIAQLTYMQDFKDLKADERTAVLNSMQYNTTYNLIDSRDNKTYQIARLKDDNIWMAENLDLGRTTLTQDLNNTNTNLDSNANTITASTFNSWIKSSGNSTYTSAELIPVTGADSTSNIPYGTLYNYCATSAHTICSTSDTNNDNATSDICPAGWRLPTSTNSGEFQALYSLTDYNTLTKMRSPIASGGTAFALAGYFSGSTPDYQGTHGYYWSSSRDSNSNMYVLNLIASGVHPSNSNNRLFGFAVRCIAKRPSRALTISYSTGVSSVQVNGITIQNGGMVNLEEGMPYSITVTPTEGYALSDWSSTSGAIDSSTSETTTYIIGSDNATLTPNAMHIIQNLDSSNCTSTASQVIDNRDGHIYTIQRLADGRCWMMENLDLGRTSLTKDLTSANTNIATTIAASAFNSWKKTSGSATYTAGEYIPVDGTDPNSKTPYGTLYNFYAASAGTISGDSNNNNATADICPARWRLPIGGTLGEFSTLYANSAYDSNEKMRAPIDAGGAAFALSGAFNSNVPNSQDSVGYYWPSTRESDTGRSVLYLQSVMITPANYYSRSKGGSIRCILDETSISDVAYMQDLISPAVSRSIQKTMPYSTAYNLIDNRDEKTYQVVKLLDGNIWMAENLDLGRTPLSKNLTSANTNITTTIDSSTFNSWIKTAGSNTSMSAELIPVSGVDTISGISYGTLYNYCAASAETICGSNTSNTVVNDICPAGWRLPTGGPTSDYATLYNDFYNSVDMLHASIANGGAAFTFAGWFSDTSPIYQGSNGNYWSSTFSTSYSVYILSIRSGYTEVDLESSSGVYNGRSVRCMAK